MAPVALAPLAHHRHAATARAPDTSARIWRLAASVVGLAIATVTAAACLRVTAAARAACTLPPERLFPVTSADPTAAGDGLGFSYFGSIDVAAPGAPAAAQVTRAVVVQHGTARNADDYYCAGVEAARDASLWGPTTAIIAPHFQISDDLPAPGVIAWTQNDGWKRGDLSREGNGTGVALPRTPSYAVIDQLLGALCDNLPHLASLVLVGHSAGGQLTQRYALTGTLGGAQCAARGVTLRAVVANPSSYAYLAADRLAPVPFNYSYPTRVPSPPFDITAVPPPEAAACPQFNEWKFGYGGDRNEYVNASVAAAGGVAGTTARFRKRDVWYLLGTNDTCNEVIEPLCGDDHSLDVSCGAMMQGPWRLARGDVYYRHLALVYGAPVHNLLYVPWVGHDHEAMFTSKEGLHAIFGTPDTSHKTRTTVPGVDEAASGARDVVFHRFYAGLRASMPGAPLMVPAGQPLTLRWSFSCSPSGSTHGSTGTATPGANCTQLSYWLQVFDVTHGGRMVVDTGVTEASAQAVTLNDTAVLAAGTALQWRVRVQAQSSTVGTHGGSRSSMAPPAPPMSAWSSNHSLFTSAGTIAAAPIWAASNSSGGMPLFALFRSSVDLSVLPRGASITSALAYVTANPPMHQTQPTKVLAGYKLWVGSTFVGMGPGRPRCGPTPCVYGDVETVYDGYDVTKAFVSPSGLADSGPQQAVPLFMSAFGLNGTGSGAPRVLLELRATAVDAAGAAHTLVASTDASWEAMDADTVYNPTGTSGCSWYWYPKEDFNASNAPVGTPISPVSPTAGGVRNPPSLLRGAPQLGAPGAGLHAPSWHPAVVQPAFEAPFVPKPTDPVAVTEVPASSVRVVPLSASRFFFDLGREVQGGVQLSVALPDATAARTVTVTMAEELDRSSAGNVTVMYPPRTGTQPRTTWALAATSHPQLITHHEYFEFRYGELDFGGAAQMCDAGVGEGDTAHFECGADALITGFAFASFGTPVGTCAEGTLAHNASCDSTAAATLSALNKLCVGKPWCDVPVSVATFGGVDPCHRVHKWLSANVTCSGAPPAPIEAHDFNVSAWVVALPHDDATFGSLDTSSQALDSVWEMCRYTTEAAPLDLYSDSNARQRSADCVADDVTSMRAQYAVTDQLALQAFAIEQLVSIGPATRLDWRVLPCVALYEHVMHSADTSLATRLFDRLLSDHTALPFMDNGTGLVADIESLVDWPPGMEDGYVSSNHSTVSSAFGYYGAVALAKVGRLIGRDADAAQLEGAAARIKAAMNELQFNGTAFCDGICAETPHTAFHSSIYALGVGAVDTPNVAAAWAYVRSRIDPPFGAAAAGAAGGATHDGSVAPAADELHATWPPPGPSSGWGMPCGTWPAQFAIRALYALTSDGGTAALTALTADSKNSWVAMLKQGATMTMEMWSADEKPNLTWSHPWASSPAYLVPRFLFGIEPTSPGFATVNITPSVGTLSRASYSQPTIVGPINVTVTQTAPGDRLAGASARSGDAVSATTLRVELPASVVARVSAPVPLASSEGHTELQLSVDGVTSADVTVVVGTAADGRAPRSAAPVTVGPGGVHELIVRRVHASTPVSTRQAAVSSAPEAAHTTVARPQPAWPAPVDRFPAMWFGGGDPARLESPEALRDISRYALAVFTPSANAQNASNNGHHAERSVAEQCAALKAFASGAGNGDIRCLAYLQTYGTMASMDTVAAAEADSSSLPWWVKGADGKVWTRNGHKNYVWLWTNSGMVDYFVDTVLSAVATSRGPAVDGVFLDDWDGDKCVFEQAFPAHYTAAQTMAMYDAKMDAMARASRALVAASQFPVFATGVAFGDTTYCNLTEQQVLARLGPSTGFMRYRIWPRESQLTPAKCAAAMNQTVMEHAAGVPAFFYTIIERGERLSSVALHAFLAARGTHDYFGASSGWTDADWWWQPEYDNDYGTPEGDGPTVSADGMVWTRRYSRCSVTLDCASVRGRIEWHWHQ